MILQAFTTAVAHFITHRFYSHFCSLILLQNVREGHFYTRLFLMCFELPHEKAGDVFCAGVRPFSRPFSSPLRYPKGGVLQLCGAKDAASKLPVVVKSSWRVKLAHQARGRGIVDITGSSMFSSTTCKGRPLRVSLRRLRGSHVAPSTELRRLMVMCCLRHPSNGQDSAPKPTESSTRHPHPSYPLLGSSRGFGPGACRSESGSPGLTRPTGWASSPGRLSD